MPTVSSSIVTAMPVESKHLAALLTSFDPPDPGQRSYRRRMLDLARNNDDPTNRHHYEPGHFTASGFVAAPNGAAVLLVHHEKIGRWL